MGATWSQMFPPSPANHFTENKLPSQEGRIFVVTGGYSGVGYHVSSMLYNAGGKVYIAGRSKEKANSAIQNITSSAAAERSLLSEDHQNGDGDLSANINSKKMKKGSLHFLYLDLSDLSTIKDSVLQFAAQESRLDVLFNNAGVSLPPSGSRSPQNHELQMATNCLGPFLLTYLLLPRLKEAAAAAAAGHDDDNTVVPRHSSPTRVVWTSSQVVELSAPKGGLNIADLTNIPSDQSLNYTNSKTGNYFLAAEFARRIGDEANILSLTTNPGALKTELLRHTSRLFRLLVSPLMYPPVNGAYTELYAGLSYELSVGGGNGGAYIIPWGRLHSGMREDILNALKPEGEDGGSGVAAKFWEWCEGEVKTFV